MQDLIFIEGLTVFAQIGVYDWEQQIKQKLIFDVEMAWDTRQAAVADDVQQRFKITWLRLKLSKPKAVAQASNVGVIIERGPDK